MRKETKEKLDIVISNQHMIKQQKAQNNKQQEIEKDKNREDIIKWQTEQKIKEQA